DHEVLVFSISKLLKTVAEAHVARGRSPGLRQRADLDQARRLRVGRARHRPCDREPDSECQQKAAACRHCAARPGAGSASSAAMSARAGALAHSRGPMAKATARPSRPTTNVV